MRILFGFLVLVLFSNSLHAQYTVNGNAAQLSCNEYRLTNESPTQTGSVWNNNRIDLNVSFDFKFDIFLGSNNSPGADGIAFVLQPISTSVGTSGSGLGYAGISPAVGVTLDTYQNGSPDNDPTYDHIAYQLNGDLNHATANNIAGPVTIISGNDNIEDGVWHSLRIVWDVATKTLTSYVDGVLRLSAVRDLVPTVFGGNSMVFWGFTGSTGAEFNYQGFKTALNPHFYFPPNQTLCINQPIQFLDSTVTFTPLAKWWWDFGDGSPIDSVNLNPIHTYTSAGTFTVIQRVRGADGCEATNLQNVTVGSKPVAKFGYDDNCVFNNIDFTDSSTNSVGTIVDWYWDFDNGFTSTLQHPTTSYPTGGDKIIKLAVKSIYGCESDTLFRTVYIYSRPVIDFTFTDSVCIGNPTSFFGTDVGSQDPVTIWAWNLGDTTTVLQYTQNVSYTFTTPGTHGVWLMATSNGSAGCASIVPKNVFVVDKPIAGITGNTICQSATATLNDASTSTDGVPINQWWWNLGNSQTSTVQNPNTTYNTSGPVTVRHVAINEKGCVSDTLDQVITISAKPVADFNYSNPLCQGAPVQFTDQTTVTGGTPTQWSWIYNGTVWSMQQSPSRSFNPGPHTVRLVSTSNDGCVSDTTDKSFVILPAPDISFAFSDACSNDTISFTANDNSGTATNWRWEFGDGGISAVKDTQHVYATPGTYRVKLIGFASNGCANDTLERDINIYGTNVFAGNDTITPSNRPLQLNATGAVSYEWIPTTNLNDPFIPNPIATLTGTRMYTYVVRGYTPLGCESFDTINIQVYQAPEIYLPNAFSPNNDGLNDLYLGTLIGIREFKYLKIFNRYGQEVFSTPDPMKGWDGTWKGKKVSSGTYVVMARGIDYRGLVVERQQTVIVIR